MQSNTQNSWYILERKTKNLGKSQLLWIIPFQKDNDLSSLELILIPYMDFSFIYAKNIIYK
jgi:hypothetical protein